MTREESINNAAVRFATQFIDTGETDFYGHFVKEQDLDHAEYRGFIAGAKWADANPKSTWISVEDDLPCNHREYVDLKYNSYTCQLLVRCKNGIYSVERMVIIGGEWGWTGSNDITHWMPIPKLEEE